MQIFAISILAHFQQLLSSLSHKNETLVTWPRKRPMSPSLSRRLLLARSGWRLVARAACALGSHGAALARVAALAGCVLRAFASPVRTCQWRAAALPRTPVIALRPPWLVRQRVHRFTCNKRGLGGTGRCRLGCFVLSPSPRLVILLSRSALALSLQMS